MAINRTEDTHDSHDTSERLQFSPALRKAGWCLAFDADWAKLMTSALSKGLICRDCLLAGHYGFSEQDARLLAPACPSCGGRRVVLHDELFSLTMAHVDCDAFYCSVEKRDNPDLIDKPVIVGGGDRGVVAAACYVARQYGIRSAMPSWQARKACPDLVVIKPRMSHYQHVGRQIRQMMLSLTPLVQPLSVDEAFLDLTGTQKLHKKSPAEVLAAFQQRVRSEIGVTVSVGLAQNKSMAKIASDQDKPDGYYVIGQAEAQSWLQDKPVQILFGLGKVTTKKLNAAGLHKCSDIVACPSSRLRTLLGRDSERVKQLACGIDPRIVETSRAAKSISSETTFAHDMSALPDLLSIAETLAQSVSQRLKEQQMDAVNVTVKLKRPNHQLLTRTKRLDRPTQMAHRLFEVASELITKEARPDKSWRLLGVGVSVRDESADSPDRAEPGPDLFDHPDQDDGHRQDRLEQALDSVRTKLGAELVKTGRRFSFDARKQKKDTE